MTGIPDLVTATVLAPADVLTHCRKSHKCEGVNLQRMTPATKEDFENLNMTPKKSCNVKGLETEGGAGRDPTLDPDPEDERGRKRSGPDQEIRDLDPKFEINFPISELYFSRLNSKSPKNALKISTWNSTIP